MTTSLSQWRTIEVDAVRANALAAELSLPRPVAWSLAGRGISDAQAAERYLNPRLSDLSDPFLLPGMAGAVDRLRRALDAGERVAVFGDYDADGVTSAGLLASVLRAMGGHVEVFLPDRFQDGYGLTPGALARCLDAHDPQLVVTADCGTGSTEAVAMARERGVDVVVTDHHELEGEPAPAVALVNPKVADGGHAAELAGVGVAFKMCHALVKAARADGRPEGSRVDLREYLDFVAVGTVADVVPLTAENRILVRHGLAKVGQGASGGLAALAEQSGLDGEMSCYHVAFVLAPRLNAAGRLGSASVALDLLLATDASEAQEAARALDEANAERKRIEAEILTEAHASLDAYYVPAQHYGLVVAGEGWHVGTIGIVAARLCNRHNRPVVVIAVEEGGKGRGSCRSVAGVDLVEVLGECSDLLGAHGGHKMAAGLTIDRAHLDGFRERFNAGCAARLQGTDLRPSQRVDAWISLGEADEALLAGVRKMRPLGQGNPAPVWGVREARVVGQPRRLGKDGKHLKMTVAAGGTQMEAIAFQMGERAVPDDGEIDVLFELQENTFRGRRSLQLNVKDFRSSGAV